MSCGKPHLVPCEEVLTRLYEFLDQELETADLTVIRQHLDECGPCLSTHDRDLMIKSIVRRCCGHEHAPAALREQIMVRITQIRVEYES